MRLNVDCVGVDASTIRTMERSSILAFVIEHRELLRGRVLDFGAGKRGTCRDPQPYRHLVAGEYFPFDLGDEMPAGEFDAILMTQVIQYLSDPQHSLIRLWLRLKSGGRLVMTGPTNWAEVEDSDFCRFTKSGIRRLLQKCGFSVETVKERGTLNLGGFEMSLGWGVVAVKR